MSALEVLVAAGISMIVTLGTMQTFRGVQSVENDSIEKFWLTARRSEFSTFIRSEWLSVKQANVAMDCFDSDQQTCQNYRSLQKLVLPLSTGTLDGNLSSLGMTRGGDFCYSYDESVGDKACPIGIELSWRAICESLTECKMPQPHVNIKFKKKIPEEKLKYLNTFEINIYQNPKLNTVADICSSLNGTINGDQCELQQMSQLCDPASGSYVLGFDPQGKVICGKPTITNCMAGDVLTGFQANGDSICSPGCAAPVTTTTVAVTTTSSLTTTTVLPTTTTLVAMTTTTAANPVNCVGEWGSCSVSCGGGTQIYSITTPASGGGTSCSFAQGATRSCNNGACSSAADCRGFWSTCSVTCGGGSQTYSITRPASSGGASCPNTNGETRACNTYACAVPTQNCVGSWSNCTAACGGGTQTYTITTPAAGAGSACPASNGATRACNQAPCVVDCQGSWGPCVPNCAFDKLLGTRKYTVTRPASGGGMDCEAMNGETAFGCPVGNQCQTTTTTTTTTTIPAPAMTSCPATSFSWGAGCQSGVLTSRNVNPNACWVFSNRNAGYVGSACAYCTASGWRLETNTIDSGCGSSCCLQSATTTTQP